MLITLKTPPDLRIVQLSFCYNPAYGHDRKHCSATALVMTYLARNRNRDAKGP